jgi:hypothetical protein
MCAAQRHDSWQELVHPQQMRFQALQSTTTCALLDQMHLGRPQLGKICCHLLRGLVKSSYLDAPLLCTPHKVAFAGRATIAALT